VMRIGHVVWDPWDDDTATICIRWVVADRLHSFCAAGLIDLIAHHSPLHSHTINLNSFVRCRTNWHYFALCCDSIALQDAPTETRALPVYFQPSCSTILEKFDLQLHCFPSIQLSPSMSPAHTMGVIIVDHHTAIDEQL
jgi:hypothetical protein